jgi:hypothetical protein
VVECENDGSKGGEGKVESHRQGRAVPQARALSGKLWLIGSLGVVGRHRGELHHQRLRRE